MAQGYPLGDQRHRDAKSRQEHQVHDRVKRSRPECADQECQSDARQSDAKCPCTSRWSRTEENVRKCDQRPSHYRDEAHSAASAHPAAGLDNERYDQ